LVQVLRDRLHPAVVKQRSVGAFHVHHFQVLSNLVPRTIHFQEMIQGFGPALIKQNPAIVSVWDITLHRGVEGFHEGERLRREF
jgi:hypothetical protein